MAVGNTNKKHILFLLHAFYGESFWSWISFDIVFSRKDFCVSDSMNFFLFILQYQQNYQKREEGLIPMANQRWLSQEEQIGGVNQRLMWEMVPFKCYLIWYNALEFAVAMLCICVAAYCFITEAPGSSTWCIFRYLFIYYFQCVDWISEIIFHVGK